MSMGFQFAHLEAYARKGDSRGRSVTWVLDEASREPGACPHVANPMPPQIVFGVGLEEVRRLHDEACLSARVTLANGKERALRKDQKTLMTVVTSHPATMASVHADPSTDADVTAWEQRTVGWLQAHYGAELLSVIRHVDEKHPHIHAYILPSDLRAMAIHPGAAAKRSVTERGPMDSEDGKSLNKRGDASYRAAMRQWQDSYWHSVGLPSGLARLGPGRRRLSRADWQTERTAAAATRIALDRAARIDQRARAFVTKTKVDAATVTAAAQEKASAARALHGAAVAKERKASVILVRAGNEAERIIAKSAQQASRIYSWSGRIRAFFDGLRRSSIVEAATRAAAQAVERERVRADASARRALEEASRRQDAERRVMAAAESARISARERDRARQELAAFRPPVATKEKVRGMRR